MNSTIPVFSKDNLQYEREEREGFYTFVPRKHQEARELIINKTSKRILDMCTGEMTLDEIIGSMQAAYPDVKALTIKKDVMKTVGSFSRMEIVSWIGENPFINYAREPLDEDYSLAVAQECDIRRILDFFEKYYPGSPGRTQDNSEMVVFWSPDGHDGEYGESALRSKLFSFSEEFLILYNGDEMAGLLGIEPPPARMAVSSVRLIVSPESCFLSLLEYGISVFPQVAVSKPAKYRLVLLPGQADADRISTLLQEGSFKEEGILQNELGPGMDLISFVRTVTD